MHIHTFWSIITVNWLQFIQTNINQHLMRHFLTLSPREMSQTGTTTVSHFSINPEICCMCMGGYLTLFWQLSLLEESTTRADVWINIFLIIKNVTLGNWFSALTETDIM